MRIYILIAAIILSSSLVLYVTRLQERLESQERTIQMQTKVLEAQDNALTESREAARERATRLAESEKSHEEFVQTLSECDYNRGELVPNVLYERLCKPAPTVKR
jgi:predicted Holliday junction resolvase-like endonuclease